MLIHKSCSQQQPGQSQICLGDAPGGIQPLSSIPSSFPAPWGPSASPGPSPRAIPEPRGPRVEQRWMSSSSLRQQQLQLYVTKWMLGGKDTPGWLRLPGNSFAEFS